MTTVESGMNKLRLEIGPVIRIAEDLHARVERDLPQHTGLAGLAAGVATAAREAERVSRQLKRPFGLHRLPATFLLLALVALIGWIYVTFFRTSTLTIALPDRDAQELRTHVLRSSRVQFRPVLVPGSREASAEIAAGRVDLAFIQGGVDFPATLPRLPTSSPELVLWFVRDSVADASNIRRVLTSVAGEGSHSVAQLFFRDWHVSEKINYLHDWKRLSEDSKYEIPPDIDAVFVVKDPSDEKTLYAAERLAAANFRLLSPSLGARAQRHDFLSSVTIPAGFFGSVPAFPPAPVESYSVATYLVARQGLTPRLLAVASRLVEARSTPAPVTGFEPSVHETSDIFQGIDAFLGILINLGLAFLALLGLEMLTYRKRFHELNSLVSLISIHQSSKDVLGTTEARRRRDNLAYLSLCSDLLGLISMIAGYYTQENSSLLFNSLPEIVHQRCDGLKINIQLKILHATIETGPLEPEEQVNDGEQPPQAAHAVS
jgi:hypothetical protein